MRRMEDTRAGVQRIPPSEDLTDAPRMVLGAAHIPAPFCPITRAGRRRLVLSAPRETAGRGVAQETAND